MANRKKQTTTETVKTSKTTTKSAPVVKTVRKDTKTASRGRKKVENNLITPVDTETTTVEKTGVTRSLRSKKLFIPLLLFGLVLLAFLASRFLVVAWVDNKPITRWDYYKTLDAKYGKDIKEQLIVQDLVQSEANKRKVTVSQEELNKEVQKIETEQGGADKLNQILQIQGISQDEFKNLVRLQILKQKMFAQDVTVSDDDVNKYIEENKAQFETVDDQLKANLKEELLQQKINTNFNNWLQGVLESSRVKRV